MRTLKALCDILLKGWTSFYGHNSKRINCLAFIIYIIVIYIIVDKISLSDEQIDNILSNLLSALSIFTALAYGILFIGPEKLNNRIMLLEHRIEQQKRFFDDADRNAITRYTNFIKSFNQDIFFVSLMSLVIISLIFIKWLNFNSIISHCAIMAIAGCSLLLLVCLFKIVATLYRLNRVSISDTIKQVEEIAKRNKPDNIEQ